MASAYVITNFTWQIIHLEASDADLVSTAAGHMAGYIVASAFLPTTKFKNGRRVMQALLLGITYVGLAGACTVSVLTCPTGFKGSLDDMARVRRGLDEAALEPPVCVLRKDFVIDAYQLLEAQCDSAQLCTAHEKLLCASAHRLSLHSALSDATLSALVSPAAEVRFISVTTCALA